MNNIFMGSYVMHGTTYDYAGIWTRGVSGIAWSAIVRSTDVVSRPRGLITDEQEGSIAEDIVKAAVEREIERVVGKK